MSDTESWQMVRKRILARDGHECQFCGMGMDEHRAKYGRELAVHHIVPKHPAGDDADDNLLTVCISCHKTVESLHARKLVERYNLDADDLAPIDYRIQDMRLHANYALDAVKESGWIPELDDHGVGVPVWVTDNMSRHEKACYQLGWYEALAIWADEVEGALDSVHNGETVDPPARLDAADTYK